MRVEHFRAFGDEVHLADLGSLNLIAGPNNVGKSSLLMPLRRLTRLDPRFVPLRGTPDGGAFFGSTHHATFRQGDIRVGSGRPRITLEIETDDLPSLFAREQRANPNLKFPTSIELVVSALESEIEMKIDFSEETRTALETMVKETGSTVERSDIPHWPLRIARKFAEQIVYLPNFRVPGTSPERPDVSLHEERRYDGSSLLADLLAWHLPDRSGAVSGSAANRVNEALTKVLETPVQIWPTASQEIWVKIGGEPPRGLDALGAGVAQVITIVVAVASMSATPLLLLEEPENCLHPGLQRRLVEYLAGLPGQSFVTTHSNHLIDAARDKSHLHLLTSDPETGQRRVIPMNSNLLDGLRDLGVSASSIASAGAIIWVEGPSDAIYLRHWLARDEVGKELAEGRDYTFAFHGGALLAHVGIEGAKDEPVRLMAVHPCFYVVADSDRLVEGGDLGHPYLSRLLEDSRIRDRVWVTTPREIEGYLPDEALVHGAVSGDIKTTGYETLSERLRILGAEPTMASRKVSLARGVQVRLKAMSADLVLDPHDLRDRIRHLAQFVIACRDRMPPIVPARSRAKVAASGDPGTEARGQEGGEPEDIEGELD